MRWHSRSLNLSEIFLWIGGNNLKADKINTDRFSFEQILECKGRKAFNEHGYLMIRGIIRKDKEAEYSKTVQTQDRVQVTVTGADGEEINLFHGILYDVCFQYENGVVILKIHLKTASYLADIKKHIRSFQEDNTEYAIIAGECLKTYRGGNYLIGKITPTATGNFLMQYQETDWEFLKRLVSMSNSVLLADDETGDVKLYIGIPKFVCFHEIKSDCYKVCQKSNKTGNYEVYEVEERELYKVGERIRFNNKDLMVCAVEMNLKGSELVNTYYLISVSGISEERGYNKHLAGNSITGKITGIVRDQVMIDIDTDECSCSGKKKFPYATIYSSPDGTGWYCMPEEGDKVRLYFPTENEADAYVESSVHLQENTGLRDNPQEKSFMNRQKKEILFTPDSLILRNNNGISVELLDDYGIKIISDKSIMLKAETAIQINSSSGEIEMDAAKSVQMRQGSTQLRIADKISMSGGKINLN